MDQKQALLSNKIGFLTFKKATNSCKAKIYLILDFKVGQLQTQEFRKCNSISNIGKMIQNDIVVSVTTQTV